MRSLKQLAPAVPEEACEVVHACLESDPERRPASAAIVAQRLRSIGDRMSGSMLTLVENQRRRRSRAWMLTAAAVIVVSLGLGYRWYVRRPSPSPPLRVTEAVVTWPTEEEEARLSPDGTVVSFRSPRDGRWKVYLVFQSNRGGQQNLWQISSENGRLEPLTTSQARQHPTDVSLDGKTVAFVQFAETSHLPGQGWRFSMPASSSRHGRAPPRNWIRNQGERALAHACPPTASGSPISSLLHIPKRSR